MKNCSFPCDLIFQKVALFCSLRSGEIVWFFLRNGNAFLAIVIAESGPILQFAIRRNCMVFLEKWPSFSCDRNLQKVAYCCISRPREIVWFFLRNGQVFLATVICRTWLFSTICDHENLYSFLEKFYSFSYDRNLPKVAHFWNS